MRPALGLALAALAAALVAAPAQGQGFPPQPLLVRGGRAELVALAPHAIDVITTELAFWPVIAACRESMHVSAADSTALARHRSWEFAAGDGVPPQTVTFLVGGVARQSARCGTDPWAQAVALARGVQTAYDSTYSADRDVDRIAIFRDGVAVPTGEAARSAFLRLSPVGGAYTGDDQLRLDLPIDLLAPRADGTFARVEVEASFSDGSPADRIVIPDSTQEALWKSFLTPRGEAWLPIDVRPRLDNLMLDSLGPATERRIRIAVARGFALGGDSSAARLVLRPAILATPCLTISPDAPAPFRAIAEPIEHPAARCQANSIRRTALRGVLLPGFGRPEPTRLRIALNVLLIGALAAGFYEGYDRGADARATYDRYLAMQAADGPAAPSAASVWREADALRLQVRSIYLKTAAVWGLSVVEGMWRERAFARSLERLQNLGGPEDGR